MTDSLPTAPVRPCARGLVFDADRVLLLRTYSAGEIRFFLPGGKQEPGERLEQTVVRELIEEASLPVRPLAEVFVRYYLRRGEARREHLFWCEPATEPASARLGLKVHPSHRGVDWMPLVDLPSLDGLADGRLLYALALRAAAELGKSSRSSGQA